MLDKLRFQPGRPMHQKIKSNLTKIQQKQIQSFFGGMDMNESWKLLIFALPVIKEIRTNMLYMAAIDLHNNIQRNL